ncbi:putative major facilitator superfamily transporter [Aureobasidium pullulans]|uniref:Putative major facilitator superfamily transporter n=1 Tax=Aureobasidium pullulans TaxID=5580 RepID=A0A4S9DI19_AURPU|nr:putative major facilitator superfamily transporter [Aureobasidium pullulans]THW51039.1 putative major facilitator superfamily transporter [Aureobasidium pullulans]THW62170.1 putative major facilitator superfamily transporter [Aureobasidium pullulans]THX20465.1 putative major facilitator superfamily transporter [Aureobasidium pullulans]THY26600.1 putative major facilitator superfamily transporter [Aureobasidium pullulans]
MAKETKDLEAAIHDQTNLVPLKQRLVIFFTLASCMFLCYVDQNGITVLLPSIAKDLNAADTIAWAGTSALIANTVFQVLYGRLSDLFGRKKIFVACMVLLAISDLICGLTPNKEVLYVFRGISGVANGGIVALVNMIMSDVVTLQQRGKYQGIIGSFIGLGNAAGPLIAAAFTQHSTWRGLFYLNAPLCLIAAGVAAWTLPQSMPKVNFRETIRKVDWIGLFFSTAAIILILIAISDGGHGTPWNSAETISMLVVGSICAIAFVIVEWKFAKLPMMPLEMWRNKSVAFMLVQSFLLGMNYYALIYYLPLYYQNVGGYDVMKSAVLILPLVLVQAAFSALGGQYMSFIGHYIEVILIGFAVWTLGSGLLVSLGADSPIGHICGFIIMVGFGAGCTFQTTNTAMQAHSPKSQRAIVISNRMLLRQLGGAVGLAISSAISGNVLASSLPAHLQYIAESTFAVPDLNTVSAADRRSISTAYANASRAVFIFCVAVIGVALVLTFFVKDKGMKREEDKVEERAREEEKEQSDHDSEDKTEAAKKPNILARYISWRDSLMKADD